MAIKARFTKQMPWVGSETQFDLVSAVADELNVSKAEVVRLVLDDVAGLRNGELPKGQTLEDCVDTFMNRLHLREGASA